MINRTHLETYSFFEIEKGPSLLILGGVHGDETCGIKAIKEINRLLVNGNLTLLAGNLTLIPISNPLAASLKTRNGERNLNRNFYPKENPKDFEDHLNNMLCPIIRNHEIIIDLHSFKSGSSPFALIKSIKNDHSIETWISNQKKRLEEKTLASWLGVKTVVGNWTDTYDRGVERRKSSKNINYIQNSLNLDTKYGTGTTEYSRENGAIAVTLECGQHMDPESEKIAFKAISNILLQLKMISNNTKGFKVKNLKFFALYEVFDNGDPDDNFLMPWKNFDRILKGTEIAVRKNGEKILAPENGCILFPNRDAEPGQEWFYLAKND